MAILASASVCDWRSRQVPDSHWAAMGAMGAALMVARAALGGGLRWEHACLAAASLMIVADVLWDRESTPLPFYPAMILMFAAPLISGRGDGSVWALASVPACYLIFAGMYFTGLIKGGADAKCLIALAIAFPEYPAFSAMGGPPGMEGVIVPAISVLFAALLIIAPLGLWYAAVNVRRGHAGRRMFSGYRMEIGEAERSMVWPAEDAEGGRVFATPPSERGGGAYGRLREAGAETVFVAPMIPFIIPLAAAFALVSLLGSPLWIISLC